METVSEATDVFALLDELVSQLRQTERFKDLEQSLASIALETDQVVECMERLGILMQWVREQRPMAGRRRTWQRDPQRQLYYLEEGYQELVDVATVVLPHAALKIIAKQLN